MRVQYIKQSSKKGLSLTIESYLKCVTFISYKKQNMKRIKIKIEDGQADELYKIAENKKENVSSLIRQAIDDYIKKRA